MKVLVACEYSGVVREAFNARGHDAWSCDLLPADDKSCKHILGDATKILNHGWDLLIAHPPCTYLTNAGVCHLWDGEDETGLRLPNDQRWKDLEEGASLFRAFLEAPIEKIAVENPIMHKYGKALIGRGQDQCVQPWMFGHMEQKATCLWLKNLPKLVETDNVKEAMMKLPKKERQRIHYASPGPDRWKLRSTTFQGIADAMAEQWG
jgi:hypothetical protein